MGGTFHSALAVACETWKDRPAITGAGRTLEYGALRTSIDALAGTYRGLGLGRGDRVVCQVANRPEHLIAAAAAWAVSAVHVGADHALTERELDWLLGHTGAAALVLQPQAGSVDVAGTVARIHHSHPSLRIVVVDDGDCPGFDLPDGCTRFSDVAGDASHRPPGASAFSGPHPADTAMLLFTSGTTGTPKGSVADHGSFLEGWTACGATLGFGPEDVHLVHLPLAHAFGLSMALMGLLTGGHVVLQDGFSPAAAMALIVEKRVTVISGAPAHYILLLRELDRSPRDVSSLRAGVGSASTFTPALLAELFARLDIEFLLMYGSSEGVGIVTTDRDDMLRGSVGRPMPNEVRIVSADGIPVAPGEVGEIAFNRTIAPVQHWGEPPPVAGHGYAGSRPGDDGAWYYSGDRGRIDDAGRLFLLGRIKHLIDRGGLKVDPVEIAAVVARCAGVADAAVIGIANPVLGESICACVVPDGSSPVTLSELRRQLARDLAPHKLPDELCIIDAVPRTSLGKTDIDALRAAADASTRRESSRAR